jgi:hypothetical protein
MNMWGLAGFDQVSLSKAEDDLEALLAGETHITRPKHDYRRRRRHVLFGCLVLLLNVIIAAVYRFKNQGTVSETEIDWSLTAVAASRPWAQGSLARRRRRSSRRRSSPASQAEISVEFENEGEEDEAAPRLKWPVHVVEFASCAPGGAILYPDDDGTGGSLGLSHSSKGNLQRGVQVHLDGKEGCTNEHLDAGTCTSIGGQLHCVPILVIPGVQKGGTGTLRQFLLHHEHLRSGTGFSTSGKEMNVFNSGRPTEDLLLAFPPIAQHRSTASEFFFDKSPNYMFSNAFETFGRMASLAPSMAICVVLRNPSDRAFSAFKHDCRHKRWLLLRRPSAVPANNDNDNDNGGCRAHSAVVRQGGSGDDSDSGAKLTVLNDPTPENFHCAVLGLLQGQFSASREEAAAAFEMLTNGLYHERLLSVLAHYPREQVLVLWFESAMRNLLQTLHDVESFVGLPHTDFVSKAEHNPATGHLRLKATFGAKVAEWLAPVINSAGFGSLLGSKLCANAGLDCGGHGKQPMLQASKRLLDDYFARPNTALLRLLHPLEERASPSAAAAAPPPPPSYSSSPSLSSSTSVSPPSHAAAAAKAKVSATDVKTPSAPPPQWPFMCECVTSVDGRASSGPPSRGEEVCFGQEALARITGLDYSSGLPVHLKRPLRPQCKRQNDRA